MEEVKLYPCPKCSHLISVTSVKCPQCGSIHSPQQVDPVLSWGLGIILGGGALCMYLLTFVIGVLIIWAILRALF